MIEQLSGKRFGRLQVLWLAGRHSKNSYWSVQCDCGSVRPVIGTSLGKGHSRSCGCLRKELVSKQFLRHGHSRTAARSQTPEYNAYCDAKKRCVNSNSKFFSDYGGRGIEFRFESFQQFLKDIGPRTSPKHSLDRINNNGHYEPGNVRWATKREQVANRRPRRDSRDLARWACRLSRVKPFTYLQEYSI
jgi:hypothetical protein